MPCKPGVVGSIPGFSIKPTFGEPLGVPVLKPTQILNQPSGTGLYPGKPQKKRNKQIDPHPPPGKNEPAHIIFLSFF